ncbi:MAG: hypothetical protein ACE5GF_06110, partial [Thermodesulfobacteriota bacterium]
RIKGGATMLFKFRSWYLLVLVLFVTSCAGSSKFMRPTQSLLSPSEDKALVRIMRPSGLGFAVNFNILDGEKVIGNSVAKSQFDYLTEPGRHLFIAIAENNAFVEADLEGGKTYYLITQVKMGAWKARVGLIPVTKGSEFWNKVKEYENVLKRLEPDTVVLKNWEEANKAKINRVISQYETVWKDKHDWPTLSPKDGR